VNSEDGFIVADSMCR